MDQRGVEYVHQTMVCLGVDDSGDVSDSGRGLLCNLSAALWCDDSDVGDHSPDKRADWNISDLFDNAVGGARDRNHPILAIRRVVRRGVQAIAWWADSRQ